MAASTKTFVNGSTPQCEDDDLNGILAENNNLIVGSGQALNTADNQQTNKAVSHYASVGDFYTAGGTANAITLAPGGFRVAPATIADRSRFRFTATSTNTGATTVSVDGESALNLFYAGAALAGGEIVSGKEYEILKNSANSRYDLYQGGEGSAIISRPWTPELWDSTLATDPTPPTYTSQVGKYTRIGNIIYIQCQISISALGSLNPSSQGFIGGLPAVAPVGSPGAFGAVAVGFASNLSITAGHSLTGQIESGANYISLYRWGSTAGVSNALISELTANMNLNLSGFYMI